MTDKEKLEKIKKLADAMYYAAFNLTTDASLLRKAMDEYHQFIINEYHKEEPVSEELEDFAKRQADEFAEREYEVDSYDKDYLSKGYYWGCKDGAKWQEDKDKQILNKEGVVVLPEEEFERMKRSLIKLAEREQQMMKDAIIATIESDLDPHGADYGNQKIICGWGELEAKKFKNGSKVKLIIIKED